MSTIDPAHLAAGLESILRPRSVAVIGASRREGSIGREILRNLIHYGFQGPVYPVHPASTHVLSLRAWPTVVDIPYEVDLAVIVVPQPQVLEVVEQCARKGVKGLVVISAGFREVGPEGAELEGLIKELVRANGMRMVGPNCMGVLNSDPDVALDASFAATRPIPGNAGFASQSGALGEVVLATARDLGLGISQFVSLGNKADVSGNDLLAWWANDPATDVVLLYLESFGNPRRFAQLARSITREHGKPILAVKAGRTLQGARAASSHTGSLAGGDRAASSLLDHCGVIRCNTVQQLFDMALGFCNQPLPPGKRIAIVSNAGGPGIMATDAAVFYDLDIAPFSEQTRARLRAVLPSQASIENPVDMIASASAEQYRACTEILMADPDVDGLLVIFVSPVVINPESVARGIVQGVTRGRARSTTEKPVLACFMGREQGDTGVQVLRNAHIPCYPFPESAAETLAAMARYQRWRTMDPGERVFFEVDKARAQAVLSQARAADREWLTTTESFDLLGAYGVPHAPFRHVTHPDEAIAFAEEHGYPVVLKLESSDIIHKSDVGAVQLDLRSPGEIKGAFWDLYDVIKKAGVQNNGHIVQKMVQHGRETIIGAHQDPTVGHLLMFGLGGVFVELMHDVAVGVHPITDADAERMIAEVKGAPLLDGYRGSPGVDRDRLREVLLRVNQLLCDFPQIAELDINPFMAAPTNHDCLAVDARVRVSG